MFSFESQKEPSSKCYITHANLPKYIDSEQPPLKRKPFSAITNQAFNHTVHDTTIAFFKIKVIDFSKQDRSHLTTRALRDNLEQ